MGIAIAGKSQHWAARAVRAHSGVEPDLARGAGPRHGAARSAGVSVFCESLSARARSAGSAIWHGRGPSAGSRLRRPHGRCPERQPRKPRAPYQWQAHAWSVTKIEWIAGANCAGSHRTDFGNVWNEIWSVAAMCSACLRGSHTAGHNALRGSQHARPPLSAPLVCRGIRRLLCRDRQRRETCTLMAPARSVSN